MLCHHTFLESCSVLCTKPAGLFQLYFDLNQLGNLFLSLIYLHRNVLPEASGTAVISLDDLDHEELQNSNTNSLHRLQNLLAVLKSPSSVLKCCPIFNASSLRSSFSFPSCFKSPFTLSFHPSPHPQLPKCFHFLREGKFSS